ncbi:unnamed protein product [Pleuronectes platessa]|uniref:Uncharacterized protein n=1 Tax=Pleuronectes platessa TaxID=8262 RepID=A0A9N7TLL3_PLEPL|nr:unnamed protein product [Pleuronectes platessa]
MLQDGQVPVRARQNVFRSLGATYASCNQPPVVVIAGCRDKWTEFAAQQTAAMRGAERRGSWVKTRAALKSQLPAMYTSPPPPPSSSTISPSLLSNMALILV